MSTNNSVLRWISSFLQHLARERVDIVRYALVETRRELGYTIHRKYSDVKGKYIENLLRSSANRIDRLRMAGLNREARARKKQYLDNIDRGCPSNAQLINYQAWLKHFSCDEQDMVLLGQDSNDESRFLLDIS